MILKIVKYVMDRIDTNGNKNDRIQVTVLQIVKYVIDIENWVHS